MDIITIPSVVLDGTTLYMKFSFASLHRMKTDGIDVAALMEGRATEDNSSLMFAIAYSCACTMLPDGKLKHAGLSIQDVEELVDMRNFKDLQEATTQALVNFLPATTSPVLSADS